MGHCCLVVLDWEGGGEWPELAELGTVQIKTFFRRVA